MNENRYTCEANSNGTQCWGIGFNRTIDPKAYSFKGTQTQQDFNNIGGYQKFSRCTSKSFSTLPFNQTYETLDCFETQTISSSQTAHADSTISSSKRLTSEYGFVEAYVNKIGKNIQQRFWERNGFTIDALVDGSCKPEDIFHNVTRVTSETMEHGTIVNRPTSRPELGYQLLLKNPLQASNSNTANEAPQKTPQMHWVTGPLLATQRELDIAINGNGFLAFRNTTEETVYSRLGNLKKDRDGNLQSQDGYFLVPPIRLPQDTYWVSFSRDGRVFSQAEPNTVSRKVGQLLLSDFPNPNQLERRGYYYKETSESGAPITGRPGTENFGDILGMFLERVSNDTPNLSHDNSTDGFLGLYQTGPTFLAG